MKANPIIIKKSTAALGGGGGRGPRVAIPGVFPSSSQFGEQVVRFRVPSLDAFIGGGVPVGSICLIVDNFPSKFGDMLLKSFIADAASYNHRIYLASDNPEPEVLSRDLPSIKKSSSSSSSSNSDQPSSEDDPSSSASSSSADLKIAWRYGHPGQNIKSKTPELGATSFDFSKKTSVSDLGGKNLHLSTASSDSDITASITSRADDVIKEIIEAVEGLEYDTGKAPGNVARICIAHCEDLIVSKFFMMRLRAIVRHTNSCAVVVMSDMTPGEKLANAEHLADVVVSIQSVVEQRRRDELGGIEGICDIRKVAPINSIKLFEPSKDIGISYKKKRLLFHELHLPPEGETTTQRETSSSSALKSSALMPKTGTGCGSSSFGKSDRNIDF